MADIRINSLPTTASASSSDDFLALDGATNGTRKLNAYSPTFGGNITVGGTAAINGLLTVTDATGIKVVNSTAPAVSLWKDSTPTKAAQLYYDVSPSTLKLGVYNGSSWTYGLSLSEAGNLTVSGTSALNGQVTITNAGGSNGLIVNNASGNALATFNTTSADATGVANAYFQINTANTARWYFGQSISAADGAFEIYGAALGASALKLAKATGNATLAGNLTVSGGTITGGSSGMTLASGGTNQSITITPNGTGATIAASSGADAVPALGAAGGRFRISTSGFGMLMGSASSGAGWIQQQRVDGTATSYPLWLQPNGGNVLVGSTADGGQKLQVNGNSGFLGHIEIPADKHIYLKDGNPARWSSTGLSSGTLIADIYANSNSLYFRTNGATLALTLDSSQNATFAGLIGIAGNTLRGVGKVYNSATGDAYGMEQVSGSQNTGNQSRAAVRFFSPSGQGSEFDFGYYSDASTFNTHTRINTTGITTTGSVIVSNSQTPASASATGTTGTIAWDASYIYVCTATNTWKRVAIATWP